MRKDLRETHAPMKLWCYCDDHRAAISNLTAKNMFQLQGQTPYSMTLGEPGDISNLCQFGWHASCYLRKGRASFPDNTE